MFYKVFHEHQPEPRIREDDEEVLSEQYCTFAGVTRGVVHNINGCQISWRA